MPKYMITVSYTTEGVRGLLKEGGSARRDVARQLVEDQGGTMESFYFAFGDADAYVLADLPDHASAAAISLAVSGSGAIAASTTVLLTPEEVDQAANKTVQYRPPGG